MTSLKSYVSTPFGRGFFRLQLLGSSWPMQCQLGNVKIRGCEYFFHILFITLHLLTVTSFVLQVFELCDSSTSINIATCGENSKLQCTLKNKSKTMCAFSMKDQGYACNGGGKPDNVQCCDYLACDMDV